MTRIRLTTKDGRFVTTVEIPPMGPLPEIIVWGERYFIYKTPGIPHTYREGFAVVALVQSVRH